MTRILPYPLLALGLAVMWLLLAGFSPGHFVLAVIVGIGATHALAALGEARPGVRRWRAIPELIGIVSYDIALSNIAVARLILTQGRRRRRSGFIVVPLTTRNPSVLALLAIVLTSTPGTAWADYNSARGEVLVHVLDLADEEHWKSLIVNRYERLLREIFE